MASGRGGAVLEQFHRLFGRGTVAGMAEGQLLDRFVARGDEVAFGALVARHGPMVWRVCRRLLRDEHAAEDAFQATFLILVRKAGSLHRRDLLGNWLYGVAYRTAARSRAVAATRRDREGPGVDDLAEEFDCDRDRHDLERVLHEEIGRLPAKYREPIVLCYLEGRTHDEAARQLGWPVGTVRGRLARARALLRDRLARRGLAPSAALVATTLAEQAAPAAVPPALTGSTVKAAMLMAAGGLGTGSVVALMEGVLKTMLLSKLRIVAAGVLAAGVTATGVGVLAHQAAGEKQLVASGVEQASRDDEGADASAQPVAIETDRPPAQADPEAAEPETTRESAQGGAVETKQVEAAALPDRDEPSDRKRFDIEILQAQLETKKAELQREQARLDAATAVLDRSERLRQRGEQFVSQDEIRKNRAEVDVQKASCEAKRGEVREAEIRLRRAKELAGETGQLDDLRAEVELLAIEQDELKSRLRDVLKVASQIELMRLQRALLGKEEEMLDRSHQLAELLRVKLLDKEKHLSRGRRRLVELEGAQTGGEPAHATTPDLERRLAEIERKLDRLLDQPDNARPTPRP